ncbi:hypothetical protein [Xanthomonas vesicatoria]|uniref:hypothetical protein n=1 Tax=Xanthomonas vesicatoria TaxID=56460 RepID=UPI001E4FB1FA|nr:hypothetical protein [Xanthomonas vesicatoria]MCC8618915.1 hypothetical protein [Xanthomonas vesicatoria]
MKKTRNRRSDSVTAAVLAAKNVAAGGLQPPSHIEFPQEAWPHWAAIIGNRARDRWNDLDLINAAELAMIHADIARLRALVRKEGDTIAGGKVHPAHKLLDTAGRRAIALSRMLHVHPEATEGRSRDAGNALNLQRQAEKAATNSDPLIPRLVVVK